MIGRPVSFDKLKSDGLYMQEVEAIHVLPGPEGWSVFKEEAAEPQFVFESKGEALERANNLAREENAEIVVHNADGSVQERSCAH